MQKLNAKEMRFILITAAVVFGVAMCFALVVNFWDKVPARTQFAEKQRSYYGTSIAKALRSAIEDQSGTSIGGALAGMIYEALAAGSTEDELVFTIDATPVATALGDKDLVIQPVTVRVQGAQLTRAQSTTPEETETLLDPATGANRTSLRSTQNTTYTLSVESMIVEVVIYYRTERKYQLNAEYSLPPTTVGTVSNVYRDGQLVGKPQPMPPYPGGPGAQKWLFDVYFRR